jgi:outer membrane biosynthesis protein TonB
MPKKPRTKKYTSVEEIKEQYDTPSEGKTQKEKTSRLKSKNKALNRFNTRPTSTASTLRKPIQTCSHNLNNSILEHITTHTLW